MRKKLYLSAFALAACSFPNTANAFCILPFGPFGERPDPVASAAYDICVQQQRQANQQREQMRLQQQQMQAQAFQMQEQARVQKQQLELQRQQLEVQRQLLVQQSQAIAPQSPSPNPGRYLTQISESVNSRAPLRLDDTTVLIRAEIIDSSVFFMLTTTSEISGQENINKIAEILGPAVCNEPVMKKNINIMMIKYTYRFFMPSGKYFDIFWNPGSC